MGADGEQVTNEPADQGASLFALPPLELFLNLSSNHKMLPLFHPFPLYVSQIRLSV